MAYRIPPEKRIEFLKQAIKNGLKVLIYDIETSHMIVRTFYIGNKVSISPQQIITPSKVISIQYMFHGDKKAQYLQWRSVPNKAGKLVYTIIGNYLFSKIIQFSIVKNCLCTWDDSEMLEEFARNILSKADIVITQNGEAFDHKVLNDRLMLQKLSILQQKPSIDILKLSRKSFRPASHKLDHRAKLHGLGGKIRMVVEDWADVEDNKVPVSKKMAPYGCRDTEMTNTLTWDELPYYKDLPVNVEKVILKYIYPNGRPQKANNSVYIPKLKGKPFCNYCAKKHLKRYDVVKEKNNLYRCKQCKGFFNWGQK